jgi:hypothetical protein
MKSNKRVQVVTKPASSVRLYPIIGILLLVLTGAAMFVLTSSTWGDNVKQVNIPVYTPAATVSTSLTAPTPQVLELQPAQFAQSPPATILEPIRVQLASTVEVATFESVDKTEADYPTQPGQSYPTAEEIQRTVGNLVSSFTTREQMDTYNISVSLLQIAPWVRFENPSLGGFLAEKVNRHLETLGVELLGKTLEELQLSQMQLYMVWKIAVAADVLTGQNVYALAVNKWSVTLDQAIANQLQAQASATAQSLATLETQQAMIVSTAVPIQTQVAEAVVVPTEVKPAPSVVVIELPEAATVQAPTPVIQREIATSKVAGNPTVLGARPINQAHDQIIISPVSDNGFVGVSLLLGDTLNLLLNIQGFFNGTWDHPTYRIVEIISLKDILNRARPEEVFLFDDWRYSLLLDQLSVMVFERIDGDQIGKKGYFVGIKSGHNIGEIADPMSGAELYLRITKGFMLK